MADAEVLLRRSLDKIAAQHNYINPKYKYKQVSTGGANYTSYLYVATISNEGKDDIHLFAKLAASGEKMRASMPSNLFDVEQLFYTKLLQEYRQLEEKHDVPEQHRMKVPIAYECNPTIYEETVVMEDLTAKGYALHDRFKSVDWDYAAKSVTELAKFHALSIALKNEQPEYFEELQERFKYKSVGLEDGMEAFVQTIQQAIDVLKEENKDRLVKYLTEMNQELFLKYAEPGAKPVIRHADFRPSNLMSKTDEDGNIDIVIIDFQTLMCGSPVIDLFYFIFLGTDKQFRDQYYEKLLDHYYEQLSAAIRRLSLSPDEEYSRKNFNDDLKEHLPVYTLLISMDTLPIITVESADAPDVNQEMDMNSLLSVKSSELFATRFNEIIDDLVEWNIL